MSFFGNIFYYARIQLAGSLPAGKFQLSASWQNDRSFQFSWHVCQLAANTHNLSAGSCIPLCQTAFSWQLYMSYIIYRSLLVEFWGPFPFMIRDLGLFHFRLRDQGPFETFRDLSNRPPQHQGPCTI